MNSSNPMGWTGLPSLNNSLNPQGDLLDLTADQTLAFDFPFPDLPAQAGSSAQPMLIDPSPSARSLAGGSNPAAPNQENAAKRTQEAAWLVLSSGVPSQNLSTNATPIPSGSFTLAPPPSSRPHTRPLAGLPPHAAVAQPLTLDPAKILQERTASLSAAAKAFYIQKNNGPVAFGNAYQALLEAIQELKDHIKSLNLHSSLYLSSNPNLTQSVHEKIRKYYSVNLSSETTIKTLREQAAQANEDQETYLRNTAIQWARENVEAALTDISPQLGITNPGWTATQIMTQYECDWMLEIMEQEAKGFVVNLVGEHDSSKVSWAALQGRFDRSCLPTSSKQLAKELIDKKRSVEASVIN